MSNPQRDRMAQILAGSPAAYDSQGLQPPAIDPIMIMSALASPSIVRALAGMTDMVPQMAASEAGAIFPEGMAMPKDKSLIQEFGSVLPEDQQIYRRNEALANWHAQNMDFPSVLKDKWALLKNAGGAY